MEQQPTADAEQAAKDCVTELIQRSAEFHQRIGFERDGLENRVDLLAVEHGYGAVAAHINGVHPIVHTQVMDLLEKFLAVKAEHGTDLEKEIYLGLGVAGLITRLLTKRPAAFFAARDHWALVDGSEGDGGWHLLPAGGRISTSSMKDLVSYDEIALAALVSMIVPTFFINNGGRFNKGVKGTQGQYVNQGVYGGLVGARFEVSDVMEHRFIVVSESQNTEAKGYGENREKDPLLEVWAEFYGAPGGFFPSFAEVKALRETLASEEFSARYIALRNGAFFDKAKYRHRMQMSIEPFLLDADARAAAAGKTAYIHAVGLGLGVWQVDPSQAQEMMEVYNQMLLKHRLPNVSDIDFSWIPDAAHQVGATTSGQVHKHSADDADGVGVRVVFSSRNPTDPLPAEDAGKLIVAQYAWDGCSFPGNEYWVQMLAASGDPAAACCSTISELQNPAVNPDGCSAARLAVYPPPQ